MNKIEYPQLGKVKIAIDFQWQLRGHICGEELLTDWQVNDIDIFTNVSKYFNCMVWRITMSRTKKRRIGRPCFTVILYNYCSSLIK